MKSHYFNYFYFLYLFSGPDTKINDNVFSNSLHIHILPSNLQVAVMLKYQTIQIQCFQPVRIVENDFLQEGEESQLQQGPVEGGQLGVTGVTPQGHQVVSHHHHGPRDEHLVEDHRLHRMPKLSWVHLAEVRGGYDQTIYSEIVCFLVLQLINKYFIKKSHGKSTLYLFYSFVNLMLCYFLI